MDRVDNSNEKFKQIFGDFKEKLSSFFYGDVFYEVDDQQREKMTFVVAAKLFIK
ncbi:hypothetical protein OH784_27440 [Ectobacillus funiculus]|uniref:hypothetical protein n=1 Tax=Ectobacillus funiculus TaxID=137993 RepID=UPI00397B6FB5